MSFLIGKMYAQRRVACRSVFVRPPSFQYIHFFSSKIADNWGSELWRYLRPVYSDTTQLDVELSWVASAKCIATPTQLNSTQVLRPDDAIELNWTQLDVELSWVELRRYKRAFRLPSRRRPGGEGEVGDGKGGKGRVDLGEWKPLAICWDCGRRQK